MRLLVKAQLNQHGGASLLAVVFTALLIMIIVIAMASLMVGELRQAIDSESSIKSYYQGESAAEEASAYVRSELVNGKVFSELNQDCNGGPTNFNTALLTATTITCVIITTEGKLPPVTLIHDDAEEQVKEFDLTGLNFDRIQVEWGAAGPGPTPFLEATMTNYNKDTSPPYEPLDNGAISTILLNPTGGGSTATFNYGPTPASLNVNSTAGTALPRRSTLMRGNPGLVNPALRGEFNSILRIRTRSNRARVQVKLFQGSSELTGIPLPDAVVDVTATMGGTFRRTIREVPIRSTTLPTEVIYSDTNICKDMQVITAPPTNYERVYRRACPIEN